MPLFLIVFSALSLTALCFVALWPPSLEPVRIFPNLELLDLLFPITSFPQLLLNGWLSYSSGNTLKYAHAAFLDHLFKDGFL